MSILCTSLFVFLNFLKFIEKNSLAFKRKVTNYIRDNDIEEYAELIDTLMVSEEDDMYDIATQNTFFFTQYIKSRRNRKNKKIED